MLLIQPHKQPEKIREYGRGNRVRKQVNYCDDDANDEANGGIEDYEDMENSESLIQVPKRRRGRRNNSNNDKSKSNEEEEEEPNGNHREES